MLHKEQNTKQQKNLIVGSGKYVCLFRSSDAFMKKAFTDHYLDFPSYLHRSSFLIIFTWHGIPGGSCIQANNKMQTDLNVKYSFMVFPCWWIWIRLEIFSPQKKSFVRLPSLLIFHICQYSFNQFSHFLCLPKYDFLKTIIIIELWQISWWKKKQRKPTLGHAVSCEMDSGITQLNHFFSWNIIRRFKIITATFMGNCWHFKLMKLLFKCA